MIIVVCNMNEYRMQAWSQKDRNFATHSEFTRCFPQSTYDWTFDRCIVPPSQKQSLHMLQMIDITCTMGAAPRILYFAHISRMWLNIWCAHLVIDHNWLHGARVGEASNPGPLTTSHKQATGAF